MAEKKIQWKWAGKLFPKKEEEEKEEATPYKDSSSQILMNRGDDDEVKVEVELPERLLWLLQTNFKICMGEGIAVVKTEGVEVFQVLSPYSALISVGEMFDESAVKQEVQKNILNAANGILVPELLEEFEGML
jgi:hypothetical protein